MQKKGILRIVIMGGSMAKQEIVKYNEDVADTCNYCIVRKLTPPSTISDGNATTSSHRGGSKTLNLQQCPIRTSSIAYNAA